MTIQELLSILRQRNIHVWIDEDKLFYRSPPGAMDPELRGNLKEQKEHILLLLRSTDSKESSRIPLSRTPRDQRNSLSFSQERLWFLDQMEPQSASYNVPSAVRLTGEFNKDALQGSLDEIVRRHEVLRTTFVEKGGRPVQVIHPAEKVHIRQIDLADKPDSERQAEAKELLSEESRKPFNLTTGPLVRALMLRLREQEHILMITLHHIVYDGWSRGVFFRELSVLYEVFSRGKPSPLPDLPIQYADYAVWQRQWLQGEILEKQLEYWKQKLEGAPPVLELPMDRPRPAVQTYQGARETLVLTAELVEGLKALSQRENMTLFMTLLAAFKVLLYRYTGSEDIVIGTPIANRTRVEIEDLIGFFVNTLVLRTDLSGEPTFRELLGRVRETTLGAYSHQDLPFEKLVEELKPERSLSHSPVFQVMFALQNTPDFSLILPELTIQKVEVDSLTSKVDLILTLRDSQEGLKASANYNTALFDARTIKKMLEHYEVLLKDIICHTAHGISEVNILTEAEKRKILVEWNDTKREYPRDKCIHELFEAQVERTPDAVAMVCEGEQLTYKELDARANQLAHYLKGIGVGSGMLVGICHERSLDLVAGLLGILKAGGAYLPLDPDYPKERLAFMIADAALTVILTSEPYRTILPEFRGRVVSLDELSRIQGAKDNSRNSLSPQNLAYVIYTSGSTGQPKGVCIPHSAVVSLCMDTDYIQIYPDDRIANASNISFDAATFEIWAGLLNGACLVCIPKNVLISPRLLAAENHKQGITVLFLTTALFNQMAREAPSAFNSIRHLLFGGEAANAECVRRILQHGYSGRLLHVYGPTESTTFASWHQVFTVSENAVTVPIGKPLANKQIYILDRHMQTVPIGVTGELFIGGDGLARGYLNHPELTAETFIGNPFSREPGARLYRTGDFGKYLADGSIEFLGRSDNQVKVRGYRIECGEIEIVLSRHSSVKVSVVVAQELSGDKRLVAYCVLKQHREATSMELRTYLKERLPDFMIPSVFVFPENLPLSPNGKIDRKRLFVPESVQTGGDDNDEPLDALEIQIGRIWEAILGVRNVKRRDNFFDLGGHSLLAVRLLTEIRKTTGKELPIATIFHSPTIMQIAEVLRRERFNLPWKLFMPVQPRGPRKPFFWIYGGSNNLQLHKYFGPDQPLYCMIFQRYNGKPASHDENVAEALKEMLAIQPDGPYSLGGFCFGGLMALELARQLQKVGREVSLMVLVEPSQACLPDSHFSLHSKLSLDTGLLGFKNSSHLPFRKKIVLLRKLKRSIKKRIYYFVRLSAGKVLHAAGFPLPYTLRKTYIEHINRCAMLTYVPYVFPGKAFLFIGAERRDATSADWSKLASGGVEIHTIAGAGHKTMREEQYIGTWAKRVNRFLEENRETVQAKRDD